MTDPNSPEAVVQRQLDAYNARDLDSLLATYAADARQYELPGKVDLVAIYDVIDGKIRSQSVRISNQRLDAAAA